MKALVRSMLVAACVGMIATASAPARMDDATRAIPVVSAGQIETWRALDGGAAGPMSVWVWLPPGYDAARGKRFPVLYMHDGQNLFDRNLTKFDQEWGIDETITRMARQGDLRHWIVVGVQSPPARYRTLFPAKLPPSLSPALRKRVEALDDGNAKGSFASDAYLRFLTQTVKRRVDASFRTLAGPADTAVMGSSMGGLMAFYAMTEHPRVFGQAAAVSMHVALADPTDKAIDHAAAARDVAEAFRRYLAGSPVRPATNRLYVDHGSGTLDGSYGPYSAALMPILQRAGWREESFAFRTYAGAEHNETAWSQRVDIPLAFLDRADP